MPSWRPFRRPRPSRYPTVSPPNRPQRSSPRGYVILYGATSGPVPPFELTRLAAFGSAYVARPSLSHFIGTRAELLDRAAAVFALAAEGALDAAVTGRYALDDIAEAHRRLGDRSRVGKLVLTIGSLTIERSTP